MRVLLFTPPTPSRGFMRNARWVARSISGTQWYPIWLAYCTGLLEKHGHEAKLVDAGVGNMDADGLVELAREFAPQLLVEYITLETLEYDDGIGRRMAEATGATLVFVGPWCAIAPEETLAKTSAPALAVGEFGFTILDLADGKALGETAGLYWKKDGQIVANPPREPVPAERLDEFPFVTDIYRRHLDIRKYHEATLLHPYVDLFSGRGCPWGRCTFCSWPYLMHAGAPYRGRSIPNVLEELRFIVEELPFVRQVFFQDDTLPDDRAREISEGILRMGLKLTWSSYARADMDRETLAVMKRAGCRSLHVGYESADQGILKAIVKGTSIAGMERFTRDAANLGFIIQGDFIVGLPGETRETIAKTIRWAKAQPLHGYQFTTPKAYPGTPFYQWLAERGSLKDGRISYEGLSAEEIEYWVARAIRECHLNPAYFWRMLKLMAREPSEVGRLFYVGSHVLRSMVLGRVS